MNDIYFGKTNDIFLSLRCINPDDAGKQEALKTELIEVLNKSAKIREWNQASSSIQYRDNVIFHNKASVLYTS